MITISYQARLCRTCKSSDCWAENGWTILRSSESAGDDKWFTANLAIGAQPGTTQINVPENTVRSSLRQTSSYGEEFDPRARVESTETVVVSTLDELFDSAICRRTFRKVDTQGFEQAVLQGGQAMLVEVAGVSLELPIVHVYSDVWSFMTALEYMASRGFAPAQLRPVTRIPGDTASVAEFDCIFRRVEVSE